MVKLLGCITVGFVLLASAVGASAASSDLILLAYAIQGNLEKVKEKVADGADVNSRTPADFFVDYGAGNTALHLSASEGHLDVVNFLLSKGATQSANAESMFPLHMAAAGGHATIATALLNVLLIPTFATQTRDAEGRTPLHLAVVSDGETVTVLLEAGAYVYTKDNNGQTPLQYGESKPQAKGLAVLEDYMARMPYDFIVQAARSGDLDWIKRLLLNGIDVDVQLQDGDKGDQVENLTKGITALHIAATYNQRAVGEFLLDSLISRNANPNIADDEGKTPLHRAAAAGHASMVTLLLGAGANATATENNGKTPQQLAQANGHTGVANDLADFVQGLPRKLWDAVEAADVSLIKKLIKNGANVNTKDAYGQTALHRAALKSSGAAVTIDALRTAANINMDAKDDHGHTPLIEAASRARTEAVRALLKGGADVTITSTLGNALHYAAREESGASVVKLLLNHGVDVNGRGVYDTTALHYAAEKGRANVVETLLDNGADVTLADDGGNTALHHAAWYGDAKVVQLLLDHGADVDAKNHRDQTPQDVAIEEGHLHIAPLLGDFVPPEPKELWAAIRRGDADEVKRLIKLGVSVNARTLGGQAAIHQAIWPDNPNLEIIHLLLAAGARATLTLRVWNAWNALHIAVYKDHLEAAELLLAYQSDETFVAYQDYNGNSALHLAAKKGDRAMVELLVAYWPDVLDLGNGAQIDTDNPPDREASIPNNDGKTPRELAQENGHTEVAEALNGQKAFERNADLHRAIYDSDDPDRVQALLNEGASIETRSNLVANTPLHTAVLSKRTAVAQFLLAKGASTEARNATGDTPLHCAARMANANMTAMLLDKDAEVDVRNIYGRTPLHLATSVGAGDVKQKLLDAGADTTIEDWYGNPSL